MVPPYPGGIHVAGPKNSGFARFMNLLRQQI